MTEITLTSETMDDYNKRMDELKPKCPNAPDGKHIMRETDPGTMPLVVGITGCYTCKFCEYHLDTWAKEMKKEWSVDELE